MAMTAESLRAPLLYTIDLKDGLIQQPLRPQLMKGDKKANTIIVRVKDGNEGADLTGASAAGTFISPVGGAEIPLSGIVDGNEVSVTLVDECYAEDGYFEANVTLTVGETSRTILSITGQVLSKGSGAIIDIGNVIPSISDIIAQYAAMKQAVEEANAARDAANEAAKHAPYVNTSNNHWMAWNTDTGSYADTGVNATGPQGPAGANGAGASASVTEITGGHRVTIVSASGTVSFDVMNGEDGNAGDIIDDTTPSAKKVYSSQKTQYELNQLSEQMANVDAVKLGGKAPEYYLPAIELIDNPDFSIAQVGYNGYHGASKYAADRWGNSDISISKNGDVITISNTLEGSRGVNQRRSGYSDLVGKPVTLGICLDDGTILCKSIVLPPYEGETMSVCQVWLPAGGVLYVYVASNNFFQPARISIPTGVTWNFKWIRMLPGVYTAETFPPYVPKPDGVELAECQRRFHVYETESARPAKPLDCCPPMELAPGTTNLTQGTVEVDGKTLYFNSTDI